ncbi:TPA: phytanoyl-CoA dioxygenase [Candidatus Poribacteria bacterium]|nr:phytanoyl-CoA dioxygenase [Candidatus Poribacteria bacterium]HIC18183.1 phytanoyl-CoA dioxygenase [Candidatus Poribacteria bacterium]
MIEFVPITTEQQKQFDQKGFLIIRQAIGEEIIAKLTAAGDRLIDSDLITNRQQREDGRYDGFRNCVTLDDSFIPLITHPTILPLVVQLLGANLHLMTSHLIYKSPEILGTPPTRRSPGWHRDYYQAMNDLGHYSIPRIVLKCAYYLTDLSQPNSGATMVAPGSNQLKEPMEIPADQVDPVSAVEPSLHPGDCLIFENRTWHAGAANLTNRIRKAVMIGYGYRWIMPMDFRQQEQKFVEKLNPLERYLVGESYDDVKTFQVDGGSNPLRDWCQQYGVPLTRHVTG